MSVIASVTDVAGAMKTFTNERDAKEILSWVESEFADGFVLTCSFETAVMPHLVSQYAPSAMVVLLDTQYLFPETLAFAQHVCSEFGISLHTQTPASDVKPDELWRTDVDACCNVRKVEPLERLLQGKRAWVTGLRRSDGFERATAPIVSRDLIHGITKVNPLALWNDDDIEKYIIDNDLPRNPLTEQGYLSIGCWPCTRPTLPGESRRDGRWAGQGKTECGLHIDSSISL